MPLLIPIAESHLEDVQRYASDPRISAMSYVPDPYPADGAIRWYEHVLDRIAKGKAMVFAVTENQVFRGVLSINDINRELGRANLDYWVAAPFHGQGIATSAVGIVKEYARVELKLKALLCHCLVANVGSAQVLQRNGFVERGQMVITEGKFEGKSLRRFSCHLAISGPGANV
ncbi:GNAT family N-acetyltransferase [Dyella terrae]|nr:GNAT family N-acetyltransferase [Dyella terrae]